MLRKVTRSIIEDACVVDNNYTDLDIITFGMLSVKMRHFELGLR